MTGELNGDSIPLHRSVCLDRSWAVVCGSTVCFLSFIFVSSDQLQS